MQAYARKGNLSFTLPRITSSLSLSLSLPPSLSLPLLQSVFPSAIGGRRSLGAATRGNALSLSRRKRRPWP